ncbi:DUF4259 domain-containing protein [Microbispora hainanensis]|uniref:DUF4259 domain-containing protein n=1 Tax=Microbispora TaxID=2005 RepID=UPI00115BAF24|nr:MULTISPECIES: DUF4259 domain-containing protein [Microbispora]NJP30171.1 DUF4259 domain-containing protein [Microbispora sp. CL1-1]TQS02595.1 DUF4259 domain-containing protein [Microbispora sp. SCL1-1]
MGTWGSGPFDSDTAEDFLEELEDQSAMERLTTLQRIFGTAVEAPGSSTIEVLPEEVTAAAAVVAANMPTGRNLSWNENEDYAITEWLDKPIPPDLAIAAAQAMEVTFPPDGWYWRSWKKDEDRTAAQTIMETLLSVLRAHTG